MWEPPDIDIGRHCSDPYDCDFHGHCWQHIPESSVFNLKGRGVDKFALYRQGIVNLSDVPKQMLPEHQLIQVEGILEKKNIMNKEKMKEFLDSLWYPICFFDFETIYNVPVPMFEGTRPYQPVPFQYSLHYLENKDAALKQYEYLAPAGSDPRRELVEKLITEIPANACVLAYNMQYEAGILNYLKEWFPEYGTQIENIISNLIDLMIPFRNRDFYHWKMEGSYSLKYVLPALVPELTYENMVIRDGEMAADAWLKMQKLDEHEEIERIRSALLAYCKMDTLAMVKILERLRSYCH